MCGDGVRGGVEGVRMVEKRATSTLLNERVVREGVFV